MHFHDTCPSSYATAVVADPYVASIIANKTGCIHKIFDVNVEFLGKELNIKYLFIYKNISKIYV